MGMTKTERKLEQVGTLYGFEWADALSWKTPHEQMRWRELEIESSELSFVTKQIRLKSKWGFKVHDMFMCWDCPSAHSARITIQYCMRVCVCAYVYMWEYVDRKTGTLCGVSWFSCEVIDPELAIPTLIPSLCWCSLVKTYESWVGDPILIISKEKLDDEHGPPDLRFR